MLLQRKLLLAMLALLGLAAIAGVATIFVDSGEFVGRIAATLVISAIAMGLAIPCTRKMESEENRPLGLFALSATIIGFCLSIIAIWGGMLLGARDEHLALTALAYVGAAIPATMCFILYRAGKGKGRPAGVVGLGFCGSIFALWCMAIWTGPIWGVNDLWDESAGALLIALAPLCASLYGAVRESWLLSLRWVGVLTGIAGVTLAYVGIWTQSHEPPTIVVQAYLFAAFFGLQNVLLRLAFPKWQHWLVMGVLGVAVCTTAAASALNWTSQGFKVPAPSDHLQRLVVAGLIVLVCGLLALGVLSAMNRRALATTAEFVKDITRIHLTCPRCAKVQDVAIGQANCVNCSLVFLIKVAEPRCLKCNYALQGLRSSVCPECGWPIGKEEPTQSLA